MTAKAFETWIILGASSTIARSFAELCTHTQCKLILAGRDEADIKRTAADIQIRSGVDVDVLFLDAENTANHAVFAEQCVSLAKGRINIFLAFAHLSAYCPDDGNFENVRRMVNVNYLGVISVLSRLAPHLERQGAGIVIAIGSVAGERGRWKTPVYTSSKAAMHVYLQGFRGRMFRKGITVTTIKPGFIDTGMTYGLPGLFLVASPDALAKACLRAGQAGREILYFPWFWRYIMLIIRLIPERIFKRLNI
jgi:short-subunit dehydrogenase